jgi:hypothetical protein
MKPATTTATSTVAIRDLARNAILLQTKLNTLENQSPEIE